MTSLTTPDNLVIWTGADPQALPAASSAMQTSVQDALAKRQRYGYVWANQTARLAQAGMVAGSQGYQLDTKSDYIYDGSSWALKTPHAEFTANSGAITMGSPTLIGTLAYDATSSTSSTFVTAVGNGQLNIVDPGIYAISSVQAFFQTGSPTTPNAATSRTFFDMTKVLSSGDQQRVSVNINEDRGSLSKPNVRTTIPNQSIYFQFYAQLAAAGFLTSRISVTRVG